MLRSLVGSEMCIRDRCSILYRMYCRWAESKGFKAHVLDFLDGEEAGIKSVTCLLYTSDAADDLLCVDLGGCRFIQ
ncbi:Peptide chain release factor 2 [Clostridium sp. C105KSO14]|nr:Peptide chain release factor 2 [Clostridium sp. C105KSO14]